MKLPKILYLDIEMAPNIGCVWQLYRNHYIPHEHILETGYTLCIAYSWWRSDKVEWLRTEGPDAESRKVFMEKIRNLLNEAEVVVHYNGTRYDIPALFKEILELGLKPPTNFRQIDLYKESKQFKFLSHKLRYILKRLGADEKGDPGGIDTWLGCMNNDPKAWEKMRHYNEQDVKTLKELHVKMIPWVRTKTFNFNWYLSLAAPTCPHCGTLHHANNFLREVTFKAKTFNEYECKACEGNYVDADLRR